MLTRYYLCALIVMTSLLTACLPLGPRQTALPDSVAQSALNVALGQAGDSYLLGGQGPDEFDCSGLIIWAYQQVYPDLKLRYGNDTRTDTTQDGLWRYNVLRIAPEQMQPGDIVFITSDPDEMTHGGLFIEWVDADMTEFRFVNASSFHGQVALDTWLVEGEKRGQWYAGAGRLKTVVN